jgi:hypothetical protein
MLATALKLAERGLAVFPCHPQDKRPACKHGCLDATVDADTIRLCWQAEPAFNIGVATGAVSKIFVVDVDGDDAALRQLGDLPPTVSVTTARGKHYYFKYPNVTVRNSAGKIAPGIDVRGDGGYVLAPPSVHPTGARYRWSSGCHNSIATSPPWLLEALIEPTKANSATPAVEWQRLAAGVVEGSRNATLTKLCGHLLRHYVSPELTFQLLHAWNITHCNPPLPEDEVARLLRSIGNKEAERRGQSKRCV